MNDITCCCQVGYYIDLLPGDELIPHVVAFFGIVLTKFTLSEILIISYKISRIKRRYQLTDITSSGENQQNCGKKRDD